MNGTVNPNVSELPKVLAGVPARSVGKDEALRECVRVGARVGHSAQVVVRVEEGGRAEATQTGGSPRAESAGGATVAAAAGGTGSTHGTAELGTGFFQGCLAAHRGATAEARAEYRSGVYEQIRSVDSSQGKLSVERMCWLSKVSRAGYYRAWRAAEPDREEMDLRDAIQRIALAHRY